MLRCRDYSTESCKGRAYFDEVKGWKMEHQHTACKSHIHKITRQMFWNACLHAAEVDSTTPVTQLLNDIELLWDDYDSFGVLLANKSSLISSMEKVRQKNRPKIPKSAIDSVEALKNSEFGEFVKGHVDIARPDGRIETTIIMFSDKLHEVASEIQDIQLDGTFE